MIAWKPREVVIEGKPIEVNGVNLWDHEWTSLDETIKLPHPLHPSEPPQLFVAYEIKTASKRIRFAAGELSQNVWGFYVDT